MGTIRVRDIKIHANHGCMEEEKKIGGDYIVNVELTTNLDTSAKSDKLEDTVDYVAIYGIVNQEMAIRSKLLEVVVERIIQRIMMEHFEVETINVEVQKINPPIGGEVGYVSVERNRKRVNS